ncbi:soluble quino protein glucose/sorbosone dehydrogenase [Mycena maculata]|uniref:Soluble quino protein glucose/sorbosone dehydrogenase n=1 Tax=Mycena maculata TaxID=230809 RepID=A0AAD7JDC2_9AGAR|nr:soluble quino protein glucose/sorbosone dehydrogenase [Mycena maculata]
MKILPNFLLVAASLYHCWWCNAATPPSTFQADGVPFLSPVTIAPGFSSRVLFSNLTSPRGITLDAEENILVVERGFGVTAFSPVSGGWERTVVVSNPNFTQGIQIDGDLLYVSTASEVLVYTYDAVQKSVNSSAVSVTGLPPDGDLTTHTLQLQQSGDRTIMLIADGPFQNIDPSARNASSGRSQIRSFVLPNLNRNAPSNPLEWASGQIIAYGIRNPAGFAFHPTSSEQLYVVENGASIDNVTGLTTAFVNDNPADEINLVAVNGGLKFYGFPDCTTLWNPKADPIGDPQYLHSKTGDQISLLLEPQRGNAWCASRANNVPPLLSFQAHSVPLDIKFYEAPDEPSATSFPSTFSGDAIVSFHGSFDRVPPTGYGVVHVPFPFQGSNYSFIIQATNLTSCPGTCIRPVGLVFSPSGILYVSSDSSGELFAIERS